MKCIKFAYHAKVDLIGGGESVRVGDSKGGGECDCEKSVTTVMLMFRCRSGEWRLEQLDVGAPWGTRIMGIKLLRG